MKPITLQILTFLCLAIATWCRANSIALDTIGDGKLVRVASWEPWATMWYIIAAIMQVIAIAVWFGRETIVETITEE